MLEKYILIGDGKDYVDVDCVREALGIKDDEDIFRAIEKLKKERDGLKAELELTNRLYKENRNFVDKVCEAVDIQRPYLESGYANAVRLITGFKRERDELKKKCDKLKLRANAAYGTSCGYSASKQPAFLCDVISYSWEFSPIVAQSLMGEPFCRLNNDSIRVELKLTPNANYNGAFDMEDLKKYIQAYGREKKLGIIESVDYQNAKAARAKLAHLYKTVLGKERLDPELSPHEIMKAILDEYKRVRYSIRLETLNAIDEHIDELCDKHTVVQPDRKSTTKERLDYIFAVLAENRERYNQVDKLARLRSDICIALCLGCETDNEDILKRVRMTKECHDALCKDYTELRKAIWEAMDRNPETLPEENARLVGEVRMLQMNDATLKRMHTELRKAIGMDYPVTNNDIVNRVKSLYDANESNNDMISDLNRQVTELKHGEKLLIEFRDDVAKAIGMDYPTTNKAILHNLRYIYKDRGDAYGMVASLNDHIRELSKAKDGLQQKFQFQSGLRQQWHARYESEHERANGVQKALDCEREKCRVKDISLETAKKQYEKVCSNLETAECALNGMKSKVRELREEKTKVISALGQDIWDDCLKEEENNE